MQIHYHETNVLQDNKEETNEQEKLRFYDSSSPELFQVFHLYKAIKDYYYPRTHNSLH